MLRKSLLQSRRVLMGSAEFKKELGSKAVEFYEITLEARKKAKQRYRDNETTMISLKWRVLWCLSCF